MAEHMAQNMDILVVEPGKAPRPATLANTLEAAEQALGGAVQVGCFLPQKVFLISRESAEGMAPNRCLPDGNGHVNGTFLLCGMPEGSGQFGSLTPEQKEAFRNIFRWPDEFMMVGGTTYADPDDVVDAVYGLWDTMMDGETVVLTKWGGRMRGAAE